MKKFQRLPEPSFLSDKWEAWGLEWEQRRAEQSNATFNWHQVEREPLNQKLQPLLKQQTQDHCSFCDAFPVTPPSDDTIEHFRPKAHFPCDAYRWANLYYCCRFCQKKDGNFCEDVLKPDAADYAFDEFFRWDFTTGTIEVNEQKSPENQARAKFTIQYFRLNEEHPKYRQFALRVYERCKDFSIDDFAYRDFIAGT